MSIQTNAAFYLFINEESAGHTAASTGYWAGTYLYGEQALAALLYHALNTLISASDDPQRQWQKTMVLDQDHQPVAWMEKKEGDEGTIIWCCRLDHPLFDAIRLYAAGHDLAFEVIADQQVITSMEYRGELYGQQLVMVPTPEALRSANQFATLVNRRLQDERWPYQIEKAVWNLEGQPALMVVDHYPDVASAKAGWDALIALRQQEADLNQIVPPLLATLQEVVTGKKLQTYNSPTNKISSRKKLSLKKRFEGVRRREELLNQQFTAKTPLVVTVKYRFQTALREAGKTPYAFADRQDNFHCTDLVQAFAQIVGIDFCRNYDVNERSKGFYAEIEASMYSQNDRLLAQVANRPHVRLWMAVPTQWMEGMPDGRYLALTQAAQRMIQQDRLLSIAFRRNLPLLLAIKIPEGYHPMVNSQITRLMLEQPAVAAQLQSAGKQPAYQLQTFSLPASGTATSLPTDYFPDSRAALKMLVTRSKEAAADRQSGDLVFTLVELARSLTVAASWAAPKDEGTGRDARAFALHIVTDLVNSAEIEFIDNQVPVRRIASSAELQAMLPGTRQLRTESSSRLRPDGHNPRPRNKPR